MGRRLPDRYLCFLSDEMIDGAIDTTRPLEIAPRAGIAYQAFADPSGGRHDSFTIAIGHEDNGRYIVDVLRGQHPPFDPQTVVADYADLLKSYRIDKVFGDAYSGEWSVSAFRDCGITYERSELNKSQLYLEGLPLFARACVSLPDHQRLSRELRLLERRPADPVAFDERAAELRDQAWEERRLWERNAWKREPA
jgi:hypothetical protein